MKKNIYLSLFLLVSLSAQADDYFKHGGIRYKIESFIDQELRVTYPDEPDFSTTDLVIPATIKTKQGQVWTVTAIGDGAFTKYSGNMGYKNLRSVSIPKTIKTIHPQAFEKCKLQEMTLDCPICPITEKKNGIADYIGWENMVLTINLGPSATTETCKGIGFEWNGKEYVAKVTLNPSNKNLVMVDGALYNKDKTELLYIQRDKTSAYIMPPTVKKVAERVFSRLKISRVVLSNSLNKIDEFMFYECKNLESVTIPNSITTIGYFAFGLCRNLTSVVIPNSVTSIEKNAFVGCSSLKTVKLPNGLKHIGWAAFSGTAIESITLPETLETIESQAFMNCKLKTLTIPKCVLKLNWTALPSSLEKLEIPEGFKKFEDYCCPKALKIVYCHAKSPQFAFSFFLNGLCHYNDLEIHVPQGCKSAYDNSDWNRDRITIIDDL